MDVAVEMEQLGLADECRYCGVDVGEACVTARGALAAEQHGDRRDNAWRALALYAESS